MNVLEETWALSLWKHRAIARALEHAGDTHTLPCHMRQPYEHTYTYPQPPFQSRREERHCHCCLLLLHEAMNSLFLPHSGWDSTTERRRGESDMTYIRARHDEWDERARYEIQRWVTTCLPFSQETYMAMLWSSICCYMSHGWWAFHTFNTDRQEERQWGHMLSFSFFIYMLLCHAIMLRWETQTRRAHTQFICWVTLTWAYMNNAEKQCFSYMLLLLMETRETMLSPEEFFHAMPCHYIYARSWVHMSHAMSKRQRETLGYYIHAAAMSS